MQEMYTWVKMFVCPLSFHTDSYWKHHVFITNWIELFLKLIQNTEEKSNYGYSVEDILKW